MEELVYKFDEMSTTSVLKGELTAKVPFKLFWCHIYIHIIIYINGQQYLSHNTLLVHVHVG